MITGCSQCLMFGLGVQSFPGREGLLQEHWRSAPALILLQRNLSMPTDQPGQPAPLIVQ